MNSNFKNDFKIQGGYIIVGIIVIVVMIIAFILFFASGQTTISGNYPESESNISIDCKSENINYPIFTYDKSKKKFIDIKIVFANNQKPYSISLVHILDYEDEQGAISSEAVNHAAMNISFGALLKADALNANYTIVKNSLRMSLYARGNEVNESTAKYFMTDKVDKTVTEFIDDYTKQGFNCTQNN